MPSTFRHAARAVAAWGLAAGVVLGVLGFVTDSVLRGASTPQAAIVEGDLKLTKTFEDGLREMYDQRADPGEERDVEPVRSGDAAALERELELYRDLDGYP